MASTDSERNQESAATRLGRRASRLRRRLRKSEPEVKKATAKAIEAARPAVERARQFAQEHEDEIKQAGVVGAQIAINQAAPPVVRTIVSAVEQELGKDPAEEHLES
jgi:hypothetical protein